MSCAALVLWSLAACAARSEPGPRRAPRASSKVEESACAGVREQARSLATCGRLWGAKRLLQACEAEAEPLLTKVVEDLGEARRSRRTGPFAIDPKLEAVEQQLARGDCQGALASAEMRYQAVVPNALAALLTGQASACLKRDADARRWYARALFEQELEGNAQGWTLLPQPKSLSSLTWQSSSELSLETRGGLATLSDVSGKGSWVWKRQASPAAPFQDDGSIWSDGSIRVFLEDYELVARDEASKSVLWRHRVGVRPEIHSAFGPGQVLVLSRATNAFQVLYQQLELGTGRVLRSGKAEGVDVNDVISTRFASWFSFETPDVAQRDILAVVVDAAGRVRRQSIGTGCSPLAAWTRNEFVSSCGDARQLFAVDVGTLARRKLADRPAGDFSRVYMLDEQMASFSGEGGVFVLKESAAGATLISAPELSGVQWRGGVRWSPDGSRLAAIGEASGRTVLVIWNLEQRRLEGRWVNHLEYSSGRRIGLAVARSRLRLALGTCPELHAFDLRNGSYSAASSAECEPALAPLGEEAFSVVGATGQTLSWLPGASPQAAPRVRFSKRPKLAISAGDWLAALGAEPKLFHVPSGKELPLSGKQLRAVSPDGTHVVYETREQTSGVVQNAVVLASLRFAAEPLVAERWRMPIRREVPALFSRDGRTLCFLIKPEPGTAREVWQELDVTSLQVTASARSAQLEGAVELSRDGSTILTTSSLEHGAGPTLDLVHASRQRDPYEEKDRPSFAVADRLVVARNGGDALLWRARDAEFLGRIRPLASGGALFTTAAPKATTAAPKAGESGDAASVQLFGEHAAESLRCVFGDRLYGWEVCADRFEEDGLLKRALEAAAR